MIRAELYFGEHVRYTIHESMSDSLAD